jgi:hypothetical protein
VSESLGEREREREGTKRVLEEMMVEDSNFTKDVKVHI